MLRKLLEKTLSQSTLKNNFLLTLFVFCTFVAYGQQGSKFKSGELIIKLNKQTLNQVDLGTGRINPHLIDLPAFDAISRNAKASAVSRVFNRGFKHAAMASGIGLDQYNHFK